MCAFTAPRTWTTGELVTAAQMNEQIRDNELALKQKEVWFPCTAQVLTGGTANAPLAILNSMTVGNLITQSDQASVSFAIPFDFVTLVSAEFIVVPNVTNAAVDWNIHSIYGAVGEAYTTHGSSESAATYNVTQNQTFSVNISGILPSIIAGDIVGVRIVLGDSSHDLYPVGVRLVYT